MALSVTEIRNRHELREFIYLPAKVNRRNPLWIPPIYMDDWKFFDPEKNRAFQHADAVLALARRDGRLVGRVMGIVNRRSNELRHESNGRFGFIECYEEPDVFNVLIGFVEDWARGHGMKKLVGPMGFSDQDPQGFLYEGFDHEPTLASFHNFPYLIRFIEAAGYAKEVDYVDYLVKVPDKLPDLYEKISARMARQAEFRLVEFAKRKELKPYIGRVFRLMNATYQGIYGYVPLTDAEIDALVRQYLPVIDPRFVKVVTRDNEVVGFVIGMPNMNVGLRQCKGHLFPFGILQIMAAMKKTKQLDLFLGAIKEDCRGRGIDVLLGAAMMRSAIAAGFETMDSHHELEDNLKMRAEMERVGGRIAKRFRIYQKVL
jgi:ribosomal protein S18 acetylase RimI-like enzyme